MCNGKCTCGKHSDNQQPDVSMSMFVSKDEKEKVMTTEQLKKVTNNGN